MSTKSTNRSVRYHKILRDLADYYNEPVEDLAVLAFEKGATKGEIAKKLKVNPAIVTRKYKKLFDAVKEEQA